MTRRAILISFFCGVKPNNHIWVEKKKSQGTVKLTQLCRKGSKVKLGQIGGGDTLKFYTLDSEEQQGRQSSFRGSYEITLVFEFVLVAWQVSTVVKEWDSCGPKYLQSFCALKILLDCLTLLWRIRVSQTSHTSIKGKKKNPILPLLWNEITVLSLTESWI